METRKSSTAAATKSDDANLPVLQSNFGRMLPILMFLLMLPSILSLPQPLNANDVTAGSAIPNKPSYLVMAGRQVEPGVPFKVVVTLFGAAQGVFSPHQSSSTDYYFNLPSTVAVRLLRKGTVVASETRDCNRGSTEIVAVKIPDHFKGDHLDTKYKLVVEGNAYGRLHGSLFLHEQDLELRRPVVHTLIETQLDTYKPGQEVEIRVVPLGSDGRLWFEPVDIYLHSPRGDEMKRWPARNAGANGPILVKYLLANPTILGAWTVTTSPRHSAAAGSGQVARHRFQVVEHDPVGFEVQLSLPGSLVAGDKEVRGVVASSLVSGQGGMGAPVVGSLTLFATMTDKYGNSTCDERQIYFVNMDDSEGQSVARLSLTSGSKIMTKFPGKLSWSLAWSEVASNMCRGFLKNEPNAGYLGVKATVKNPINGQEVTAYSTTLLTSRNLIMGFSVASPVVFSSDMPFDVRVWVQMGDGRALTQRYLEDGELLVEVVVQWSNGRKDLLLKPFPVQRKSLFEGNRHSWLMSLPSLDPELEELRKANAGDLGDVAFLTAKATFTTSSSMSSEADLVLLPSDSLTALDLGRGRGGSGPFSGSLLKASAPRLQLSTSTKHPRVGESLILHLRSNYVLSDFNFVVVSAGASKGGVITTRQISSSTQSKLVTFDELVTSDMFPTVTLVVWHVDAAGTVAHCSLTIVCTARQVAKMSAHPIMEGANWGYTQVSVTGEPDSVVALRAGTLSPLLAPSGRPVQPDPHYLVAPTLQAPGGRGGQRVDEGFGDLLVLTDGGRFEPGLRSSNNRSSSGRATPPHCQPILPAGSVAGVQSCDRVCDCSDCSDEFSCPPNQDLPLQGLRRLRPQSLASWQLQPNDFWRVVKVTGNGSSTFRVPFSGPQQKLRIIAAAIGSRGLAALPPQRVTVGSYFHAELELPKHCKVWEHVSIRLTCINHGSSPAIKSLKFSTTERFRFLTSDGIKMNEKFKSVDVRVEGNGGYKVIYIPIAPLQTGRLIVSARLDNSRHYLTASTEVSHEGLKVERHQVLNIDMRTRPYFVGTLGNAMGGPTSGRSRVVDTVLTVSGGAASPMTLSLPINVSSVLSQPMVTADEAIFSLAMTLQHQRSAEDQPPTPLMLLQDQQQQPQQGGGSDDRAKLLAMSSAYQRLLSYQNPDGSFSYGTSSTRNRSESPKRASSVFLTASALAVLYRLYSNEASHHPHHFTAVTVDGVVIQRCLQWLLAQQLDDGSFREAHLYHGTYQRLIPVEFQAVALTAHVVTVLSRFMDEEAFWKTALAMRMGAGFLAAKLGSLDRSGTALEIALSARALQVTRSVQGAETAFEILAKRRRETQDGTFYWGDGGGGGGGPSSTVVCEESLALRSTALALMVYTERREFMTEPIVGWLNSRRKSGWGSASDTILVSEALAAWAASSKQAAASPNRGGLVGSGALLDDSNADVIELEFVTKSESKAGYRTSSNVVNKVAVHGDGRGPPQQVRISLPDDDSDDGSIVRVEGRGRGLAVVTMKTTTYTTDPKGSKSTVMVAGGDEGHSFSLEPRLEVAGNSSMVKFLSCQRWHCPKEGGVSGPSALLIDIPSGFALAAQERDSLTEAGHNVWTQDNRVVYFFEKMTTDFRCVNFTLLRDFPVARLSPYVSVELFDWYSPERRNSTLMFVPSLNSISICDVCGSPECAGCPDMASSPTTDLNTYVFSNASELPVWAGLKLLMLLLLVYHISPL